MDSLCRVRNKIMHVLSWRTVSALTRVLFWYLLPSLLRNSGSKHQNNPLVSSETIRHSSTYIILYAWIQIMTGCGRQPAITWANVDPHICRQTNYATSLTHWGLTMPYGNVDLDQHWLKKWQIRAKFYWPHKSTEICQWWQNYSNQSGLYLYNIS